MKDISKPAATARRMVLTATLLYPVGLAAYLNLGVPDANAMPIDFAAFWGAARLAVEGAAVSAFDWQVLSAVMALPESAGNAYFSWQYPPRFLLVIAPLGWLNFSPAFFVYILASIGAFWFALRPWVGERTAVRDLVVASPAVLATAFAGNTSLMWMATFLAAIHFRGRSHHLLAGVFIALLTLKPQLGPIIAVALLAARDWATIAWSAIFTIAFAALATLAFGVEYWPAFLKAVGNSSQIVAEAEMISRRMVTWFAFMRQHAGLGEAAYLVQGAFTVFAAVCVAVLWAKRDIDPDLRIAGLLLAILTGAIYAFQYEMLLSTVAILFLARAGAANSLPGRIWLALLWLLPLPHRVFPDLIVAQYAAPVLAVSLIVCMAMALRQSPAPR